MATLMNGPEMPVGPWSKLPSSKSLCEGLRLSKYSQWAKDLKEEELLGLLWAVGEYGYRANKLLEILRRHKNQHSVSFARAMAGLEISLNSPRPVPARKRK